MQNPPPGGLPEWPSGLGFSQAPRATRTSSAASLLGSLLFHGALVAGIAWLTLPGGEETAKREWEQITFIQLEREAPAPPSPAVPELAPPPPAPAPPPPQALASEPPPMVQGFQTLQAPEVVPAEIPPPGVGPEIEEADFRGEGVEGGRASGVPGGAAGGAAEGVPGGAGRVPAAPAEPPLEAGPRYTPMTVPPALKNPQAVARALETSYPQMLRNAGVGGTVVVWLLIDGSGKVLRHQIKTGSGQPRLDAAALRVVEVMQFTPAMHHDRPATVWVDIPIIFSAR